MYTIGDFVYYINSIFIITEQVKMYKPIAYKIQLYGTTDAMFSISVYSYELLPVEDEKIIELVTQELCGNS